MKSLYVSVGLGPFLASVLEELAWDKATEVLPRLGNLFLEGLGSLLVEENIGSFVSMRQLTGHPVVVQRWE